jgi:hypothetical protein
MASMKPVSLSNEMMRIYERNNREQRLLPLSYSHYFSCRSYPEFSQKPDGDMVLYWLKVTSAPLWIGYQSPFLVMPGTLNQTP